MNERLIRYFPEALELREGGVPPYRMCFVWDEVPASRRIGSVRSDGCLAMVLVTAWAGTGKFRQCPFRAASPDGLCSRHVIKRARFLAIRAKAQARKDGRHTEWREHFGVLAEAWTP